MSKVFQKEALRPPGFRLGLTHAYPVALLLIACSMLSAYLIATHKVRSDVGKASTINNAGMQRMLSQRLGLMAHEIIAAERRGDESSEELIRKFDSARQQFTSNHTMLLEQLEKGPSSQAIRYLYTGEHGVDARSREFIELADEFMLAVRSSTENRSRKTELMTQLVTIASNGFLDQLDEVVTQREIEASAAIDDFTQLALVVLCISLLLLLGTALFIFRPVARAAASHLKKLETSNRELKEFSFRISHDLRSPIASCRGLVEIAQEALEEEDATLARDMVDRMEASMVKMDTLIEDILDVTRSSVANAEPEPVNLRRLIEDSLNAVSSMKDYSKVQIDVDIKTQKNAFIQKLYLRQIVENLLSNAIKYADTSNSQTPARVSACLREHAGKFELTVEDNGLGIPENCREKLFGMFARFHPKLAQGSGLGLYLSRQNAIAMGGNLYYEPASPGSRFIVTFKSARETR